MAEFRGYFTDRFGHGAHPIVWRVRHVEPKDIHAELHELLQRGRRTCGRTDCGDDFCAAHENVGVSKKDFPNKARLVPDLNRKVAAARRAADAFWVAVALRATEPTPKMVHYASVPRRLTATVAHAQEKTLGSRNAVLDQQ